MPGTSLEDLELVARSQQGDVAAFAALVERYQSRVYNLAYRMLSNADDAADVAQDAFLSAFEGLARFRAESSFYTWLYRIVVNKSLAHRRTRGARAQMDCPLDAPDAARGPERVAQENERARIVQEAIASLPPDFRAVVVLRDIEGLEYEEVAEVAGLALGTVKSRLHRGRLLLREALAPYLGLASSKEGRHEM